MPQESAQVPAMVSDPQMDPTEHPAVMDVNQAHSDNLSKTETVCKDIADLTGAPLALLLAIVLQLCWVAIGIITHWDPYPFLFLLTCSNILQLILIFVIAVSQKRSSQHDELRAESDHDSIARLLHHQEVQEEILMRLAEHTQTDVSDIKKSVQNLMQMAA